jgi:hypothetical protein
VRVVDLLEQEYSKSFQLYWYTPKRNFIVRYFRKRKAMAWLRAMAETIKWNVEHDC